MESSRDALDAQDEVIGYEFIRVGPFLEALKKNTGTYGRFTAADGAVKFIDPRHE